MSCVANVLVCVMYVLMLMIGDTYLRLMNSAGTLLALNDDGNQCGLSSLITYTVTSCDNYQIREGCFTTQSCSGTVAIYSASPAPSRQPTIAVTAPSRVPSLAPTSGAPSLLPTPAGQMTTLCPPYSATNTNNAQQNYAICTFSACAGNYIISTCPNNGGTNSGMSEYM